METAKKVFWLACGLGAVAGGALLWKHKQPLVGVAAIVLGAAEAYQQGSDLLDDVMAPATGTAASTTNQAATVNVA